MLIGWFIILLGGGQMRCAKRMVGDRADPLWTGKFPVFVIAHRGFSGVAPENTLIAFKKAIEVGSDMIELDVHLSKDGHVVVIHDDTLDRTTNGKGKVVDWTLEELKRLDAGSKFDPKFSGEKIPTLKEVLDLSRSHVLVNIELKRGDLGQYTLKDLTDRSLQEVERAGVIDQTIFSSFDPSALERIREKNPRVRVAYLYNKSWNFPQEVIEGRSFNTLSCRKSVLTDTNISKAHKEGVRVNVYTLNSEEEIERFLNMNVDGIITDYPDRLIKILQKRYRLR